jgi:hypothetical protein
MAKKYDSYAQIVNDENEGEQKKKSLYDENESYSSVTEEEHMQRKIIPPNNIKILNKGEILTSISTRQSVNLFIK